MRMALILCLALAGCATPSVAPVVTVSAPACLPLTQYDPAEEKAMAAALAALPKDSPLVTMIEDYGRLRSADRACLNSQSAH